MSNGSSAVRGWPPPEMEWTLTLIRPRDDAPRAGSSDLSSLEDRHLVELTLGGDRSAFDVLVGRHQKAVYQLCYRFVPNHDDASDLAQDVFVRAWKGLSRFKGDAAFTTWLYRITVNVCLSRVSAKRPINAPAEELERLEDVQTDAPGTSLRRAERAEAVRRAIHALPEKQRATLVLRIYHELTHQQIAEILGSSVGAVKANFFHALGNLRKLLGAEP
ncbi:MAG TPA: sigma-70 family RNA polymerase sigma factor [Vicinamibacterales bacterium]|nr:sigma-70 family RNA polymerase sigma factor [Vicinamibacterales bacterium]